MKPIILMRDSLTDPTELEAAEKHLPVVRSRSAVPGGSLVVARYSCLPYYQELEEDLNYGGSRLINTYRMHRFVADAFQYSAVLGNATPAVWTLQQAIAGSYEGPFVLKGETNSRKHLFRTHMYAEDKKALRVVYSRLLDDSLIGSQEIVIRPYVPLWSLGPPDPNGLPFTHEVRVFALGATELARGFYWSESELRDPALAAAIPQSWLQAILNTISQHIRFYVVDVARTAAGDWIVIECNDGQQSGLSCIDPEELYKNLKLGLR